MQKISVIIPVYNVEKYMSQCINSVLNQTYKDFEIILVDDGSTDKSPEICDEYTLKDKRVKTIHQKNKGLGGARNTGLDNASGEYVLFIDSDDWIEPDALEVMIDKIEKTGADFVIAGITLYIDDTKEYRSGWIKDFSDRTGVYEITSINFIETFTPAWARLYRKSFIDKNYLRFVENCYYEDNSWGCLVACFASKIAFVKKLFYYRQHKNQITAKKDEKVFDWIRDFRFFYDFIKNKNINPEKLEMAKMWYLLNFFYYYNQLSLKNKKIFRGKICEILPLLDMDTKLIETTKVISSKNERIRLIYFFKFLNSKFLYKYYYSYKNCIKKFFSIRNSNDRTHKIITIFGIKIKIKKNFDYLKNPVNDDLKVQNQVQKYLIQKYILPELNGELKSYDFTPKKDLVNKKVIWQYWGQGINEKTPKVVQVCFDSVKKYKEDYEQIILTNDNVLDYIDLPDFILEKFKNKQISYPHFSDVLRICLLSTYGGIWIDSTVLLTNPLPEYIKKAPFFSFQRTRNSKDKNHFKRFGPLYFNWSNKAKVKWLNSFIVATRDYPLINALKNILLNYWQKEEEIAHYFQMHIIFDYLINNTEYKKYNCKKFDDTLPHLMQLYFNSKYTDKLLNKILSKSSIHKLTYKTDIINGTIGEHILKENLIKEKGSNHNETRNDNCKELI